MHDRFALRSYRKMRRPFLDIQVAKRAVQQHRPSGVLAKHSLQLKSPASRLEHSYRIAAPWLALLLVIVVAGWALHFLYSEDCWSDFAESLHLAKAWDLPPTGPRDIQP
jgi:hypothetical protein